jgi:hypothetical protein
MTNLTTPNSNLIPISFEDAISKHQKLVEKFLWLLRNNESSSANTPLEKISWYYSFTQKISDILNDDETYKKMISMSFEDRLEEEMKRTEISLCMSVNTGDFAMMMKIDDIPDEVRKMLRKITARHMLLEKFLGFSPITTDNTKKIVDEFTGKNDDETSLDINWNDLKQDQKHPIDIKKLEQQIQQAIDEENYEEAARIRNLIEEKKKKD